MKKTCNGLDSIVAQAILEMKTERGTAFNLSNVNLSELERRTGISRSKLRTWKRNGFVFLSPGPKTGSTCRKFLILQPYVSMLDSLLKSGVSNSTVCLERLQKIGFNGSLSTVKRYITAHKDLIPVRHKPVERLDTRSRRYSTAPGEMYQMDWGFVNVTTFAGHHYQAACFAMSCHHCGEMYIEFFPNARQESLFIGMIHAFRYMGIPKSVMTDNMKSVVIARDWAGIPIWQKDYEAFMKEVGFKTILCKPRHPYTKGKVERLVRFVKENFLQGRTFENFNDLNEAALDWCNRQNKVFRPSRGIISDDIHHHVCLKMVKPLKETDSIRGYLCPLRKISYDGFITYEHRRYGVPFSYKGSIARVCREGRCLTVYSMDLQNVLASYMVDWSMGDHLCPDQFVKKEPEEVPTEPVHVSITQKNMVSSGSTNLFFKFNFEKGGIKND